MNSVEATLKHTHGAYGPAHMACHGPITDMRDLIRILQLAVAVYRLNLRPILSSKGFDPVELCEFALPRGQFESSPRGIYQ